MIGAIVLSGCQAQTSDGAKSTKYEIRKDGVFVESNKNVYDALGSENFVRTQTYRIRYVGNNPTSVNQLLVVKLKIRVGEQDISESYDTTVIDGGEGKLACAHFYDIKIVDDGKTPDPTCTLTVIGAVNLDPTAAVQK